MGRGADPKGRHNSPGEKKFPLIFDAGIFFQWQISFLTTQIQALSEEMNRPPSEPQYYYGPNGYTAIDSDVGYGQDSSGEVRSTTVEEIRKKIRNRFFFTHHTSIFLHFLTFTSIFIFFSKISSSISICFMIFLFCSFFVPFLFRFCSVF